MKILMQQHNLRAQAALRSLALIAIVTVASALASAQKLSPMFGNGAGKISMVESAPVAQDQFVTAVINSTGNLEVIAWHADLTNNKLTRQGTVYVGKASSVAISSPYSLNAGVSGVFTTAAINASGKLDLSYWQMQPNGTITQLSEVQGDSASIVSVASVYSQESSNNGAPQFMTAIRNGSGSLEVSLWHIDSNSDIQLSGTAYAGGIFGISIACLQDLQSDVVTAVENSTGDLELIQWYYGRFGAAVTRGNTTYTSTPAWDVAVAPGVPTLDNPPNLVDAFYTAAINPSNNQITTSAWNQILGLQANVPGSLTNQVALTASGTTAIVVSKPGENYFVQVLDQDPNFGKVVAASGKPVNQASVTLVDTSSPNVIIFAVTYHNGAGNLQIDLWKYVRACSPYCG
jgi:hypothetical protein